MGIDHNALQFLRFAAKHARFGRVATIGRQSLDPTDKEVCSLIGANPQNRHEQYCDTLLLEHFGATCVDSWDYSDYEGANYIADMNKPLNERLATYDTVIDAGSLEHVYNAPQALQNVSELCCDGGQILHMLPGSNYCGHGFWQFSPELFFSLYCEANGYTGTRVFLVNSYRTDTWYEVRKPENGRRALVITFTPTFVFCRTVKVRKGRHDSVQQSDYVHLWHESDAREQHLTGRPVWRAKIVSALQRSDLLDFAYILYIKLSGKLALSARNPHLIARSVRSLAQ